MRVRFNLALLVLILLLFSQSTVKANTNTDFENIVSQELVWEKDLGEGYITTSPLIHDDSIIVRTSGTWFDESRPMVYSFDFDGNLQWSITGEGSTSHDMAPLHIIPSGEGNCGNWSQMLVVAWANGSVQALNPTTGDTFWTQNTAVHAWGITGSMLTDADRLVVPTRNGVDLFCLADGQLIESYETGFGWRNGVSVLEETILIGDEQGLLWSITGGLVHNTSLAQELQGIENAKIRHAPIILDDFVVVSVQGQSSGKVLLLNKSSGPDFQIIHEFDIGMSSSIPTKINQTAAIVGSSAGLQLVDCSDTCTISESLSDNINGEIFYREGVIVAARNGENGGWVYAQVKNSKPEPLGNFQIQLSGWGTAMPANCGQYWIYGNDQGILQMYESKTILGDSCETTASSKTNEVSSEEVEVSKAPAVISLLLFSFFLVFSFTWECKNLRSAFKFSIPLLLIALILSTPYIVTFWSGMSLVELDEEQWDEDWPNSWKGTQVISFELEGGSIAIGDIGTYSTVSEATIAAAEELEIHLVIEETNLGNYLISIDGYQGDGWEFFVDGSRGLYSIDDVELDENSVLVWRPA